MTTIVTGMWGPAAASYGRGFFSTFDRFAGPDLRFRVYAEKPFDYQVPERFDLRPMSATDGWEKFIEQHRDDPRANGRAEVPGWKDKDRARGYTFRFDAVRFAGQAFIPEAAAAELPDGEVLVWLDADVVAFKEIPVGFFDGLLGDTDGAYLGRGAKHSEIGYWSVRLNSRTRLLLAVFADLYRREDRLFSLREWHSAFVWDEARRASKEHNDLRMRDLTPGGTGHVWWSSPLCRYLDHLKGERRKESGKSRERFYARAR